MYQNLVEKKDKLAVIGLGYVGLPIALEFARKISVVGFDIKPERVEMMRRQVDPSNELDSSAFSGCDIVFTSNVDDLRNVRFFIVAVPTPIDSHNLPDLQPLLAATRTVGSVLKKGDYVVYESTVYPGCTQDDCVPLLEELSGLKCVDDFKVGFSPERINPGDKQHTLTTIKKITSGCDPESAEEIAKTYELVVKAGVHRASSIKVAEAAKIIENTQRDINIAFMNELSILFNLMNINTFEVLEAAGTKWNFLKFAPGLVGGHCIGVDPYYLVYKAKELGYHPQMISSGRFINDSMGSYIAKHTVKKMISAGVDPKDARVLILGVTFKENVCDIRNSKVRDIHKEFRSFGVTAVDVVDPLADPLEVKREYGFITVPEPKGAYNAIVVAVGHRQFMAYDETWFQQHAASGCIFVDVKGFFRNQIKNLTYWSL